MGMVNMLNVFKFVLTISFLIPFHSACAENAYHQVLSAYIALPEKIDQPWIQIDKRQQPDQMLTMTTYILSSQYWPKKEMSEHATLWQHRLTIYKPDRVKSDQALLFVNGGTRYPALQENPLPQTINFARIAAETHSIVVDLQDVPNQYLSFEDKVARKEDGIIAYSWKQFLNAPANNQFWPGHLPMTKAIVKAMDAVQAITKQESPIPIQSFVVAGASKRGWATWLAALADQRVKAIVPIVIDVLNTKENIKHIYNFYDHHWPPAFYYYIAEKIVERIDTPEFDQLMQIEDPLSYLTCDHYKNRLSIPKYIISASGDDFYVPDSLNLYLSQLPGETIVRVLPNQPHYLDMVIVENALLSFYKTIVNHTPRPTLTWQTNAAGKITKVVTSEKPISAQLWEAENPNGRDFRMTSNIRYTAKRLQANCINNRCEYRVDVATPKKGWKSHFVEVVFSTNEKEPMVLTTSAFVIASPRS